MRGSELTDIFLHLCKSTKTVSIVNGQLAMYNFFPDFFNTGRRNGGLKMRKACYFFSSSFAGKLTEQILCSVRQLKTRSISVPLKNIDRIPSQRACLQRKLLSSSLSHFPFVGLLNSIDLCSNVRYVHYSMCSFPNAHLLPSSFLCFGNLSRSLFNIDPSCAR